MPSTLPLSVSSSHVFSGPTFSYNLLWLVEIYVKDLTLDFLLVRPIMETGINIVDVVKYISFMMAYFVLVVVWHYVYHQLVKEIRKG